MPMQDYRRLRVGAILGNSPSGLVVADIVPYEGGEFSLTPKKFDNGLVLVDPNRPASYGFQIQGSPETLRQLANALLAVARSGDSDDTDAE